MSVVDSECLMLTSSRSAFGVPVVNFVETFAPGPIGIAPRWLQTELTRLHLGRPSSSCMNTSRSLSVLDRLEIFELFAIDVSEQNHVGWFFVRVQVDGVRPGIGFRVSGPIAGSRENMGYIRRSRNGIT